MLKVIRNGKVAVLTSPGYGAGWIRNNPTFPQLLFHPTLVEMVEQKRQSEITEELMAELLGVAPEDVYAGGAATLTIDWVTEGSVFEIEEHDGYETLNIKYFKNPVFVA